MLILAGPNGAGKSTLAPFLLRDELRIDHFVNADEIARGLSAFAPDSEAMAAGRLMLQRLNELKSQRATFAFETTLASRSFAPWVAALKESGYSARLVFLYLNTADLALARVAQRVRQGGHTVPEPTIRRRYVRGLRNLRDLYIPLMDEWTVYNVSTGCLEAIATGRTGEADHVFQATQWSAIQHA